ncbi:insulinase family protein [Candidatus Dependentiae bacterium]|nr:insulinase family protein [Candidatus Dependentiae bacterium]
MKKFRFMKWYSLLGIGVLVSIVILSISILAVFERKAAVERPRVTFKTPKNSIKKVVLDNGMTVLVHRTTQVPKVLVQIAYDVGSGVEESGERGLAHLIEHMIFKGTQKLSEGDIDAIARKYGADFNAFTSKDVTSYYFEVNKNNWKPFVELLADCMSNARFEEEHLASEMKTVIQELRMLEDNYWRWMINKACELVYPSNHPYHHPTIGYKEDLLALSAGKLRDFYEKYYHPHKATLFIVGDVDINEAIEVARTHFDFVPDGERETIKPVPSESVDLASQVNRVYKDIKKELQGFYWKIPGLKSGNQVLASVVEGILGQGEGSVLYRRLVDEEKIATSVQVGSIQLKESGILFVLVEPKEGCSFKCKVTVTAELVELIKRGVDSFALAKVIRRKEREFFSMLETSRALTYEWIQSFFSTGDEFELFKRVEQFYQIDEAMVKTFIQTYLDPFLINELKVLPLPAEKREQWLENKNRSEKEDAAILQNFVRTEPVEEPLFATFMPEPKPLKFSFPQPDRVVVLENGLKVILRTSGSLPLIYTACRFNQASYFSMAKEGIVMDVMMNMLMEKSVGFSKTENVDCFELHGAGYSFDSSGARLMTTNVGYLPVLKCLFHVLTMPEFEQGLLEKVKEIFVDSYKRSKDSPQSVAIRLLKSMVYKSHPYGWDFDDAIELIEGLTVADLQRLHSTYVSPANMTIVVSGDFNLDQVEATIKEVFGRWQHHGKPVEKKDPGKGAFEPGGRRDYPMLRDQVVLLLGQSSPINIYHPDRIPLKLVNFICFHSLGSHLFKLREQTGLFYVASGGWGESATGVHGFDYLYALLNPDNVDKTEGALKKLVDRIGRDGVTLDELDDARQWTLKGLIDLVSSNGAVAGTLGTLEEFGLGFDYYDKALARVQSITADELRKICKKHFNSKRLARVRVGRIS